MLRPCKEGEFKMKSKMILAAMGMMLAVAATGCNTYQERTIDEGTVVEQRMIVE